MTHSRVPSVERFDRRVRRAAFLVFAHRQRVPVIAFVEIYRFQVGEHTSVKRFRFQIFILEKRTVDGDFFALLRVQLVQL